MKLLLRVDIACKILALFLSWALWIFNFIQKITVNMWMTKKVTKINLCERASSFSMGTHVGKSILFQLRHLDNKMISADVKAQDLAAVFMYLWLSKPISFWKIKSSNIVIIIITYLTNIYKEHRSTFLHSLKYIQCKKGMYIFHLVLVRIVSIFVFLYCPFKNRRVGW